MQEEMKIPEQSFPSWKSTVSRLDVKKKELKMAARYYGLTLRELYWYCDFYVKAVKYDVRNTTIDFSNKNQKGKVNNRKVDWGAVALVCMYNNAARGGNWLDGLILLEKEYIYIMAQGRINEYGQSVRENAMSLYYRGDDAAANEDDGLSCLLHPNQALELATLFTAFLLNGVAINDFVNNVITLDLSWEYHELTNQQEEDYRPIVAWIMKELWPKAFTMNETTELIPKRLLEIINMTDHNRYRATIMLVLYLIGLNDFSGNILFAAGDCPMDELGVLWIDAMLKGNRIEDIRTCSQCGKEMGEGYVVNGGDAYYCSGSCLHKNFTTDEWKQETRDNFGSCWTTWIVYG